MVRSAELTPREIVAELNRYIVGQEEAKRSVAIALRNRYRRRLLPKELREEVLPKNIIMIGPTGVGKTEIARRLAKMVRAPFIKVEVTKFTEVGYVGRDVESVIRDLTEVAVRVVHAEMLAEVAGQAQDLAEERLLSLLLPTPRPATGRNPFEAMIRGQLGRDFGSGEGAWQGGGQDEGQEERRRLLREKLHRGELEQEQVEVEVEEPRRGMEGLFQGMGLGDAGLQFQEFLGDMLPKRVKKRRVSLATARSILTQQEAEKLVDYETETQEALRRTQEEGIVFLDEIDKIAGRDHTSGPDVSRGGVQRDLLPLVEGTTVTTRYGPVKSDHILFIAAGAFHLSKPSDLIPELQGRFPIRVELTSLSQGDFRQILTEPANSVLQQYIALLATEGIKVEFTDNAIDVLAEMAYTVNIQTEDIGARRLYTILERLLQDLLFEAPELGGGVITIDAAYVRGKLSHLVRDQDLSSFIL